MTTTTTPTIDRIITIAGRTPSEIGRILTARIEELDRRTDHRYCLEYVSASYSGEGADEYWNLPDYQRARLGLQPNHRPIRDRFRWVSVYPVTGGSEGHYLHVELIYQRDAAGRELRSNLHVRICLVKIFGGWDAAAELAGIIGRWLDA